MPQYTNPGVYIEEVDSGAHPIAGVSTDRTALVGLAPAGPWAPTLITSFTEYQQTFGGAAPDLNITRAVRGFFDNGGQRCYVLHVQSGAASAAQILAPLDHLTDISMVSCPDEHSIPGMTAALVAHCENHRDRVAVLAATMGSTYVNDPPQEAQSGFAAFYAPWVLVASSRGGPAAPVHPGGHVAGAIAANDLNRGVWVAPGNLPLAGIVGLEQQINAAQASVLNQRGIDTLRNIPPNGCRVWGARTTSSDPEWQYLNVRRYLIYLEQSLQQGLQWAVFEPNGGVLWANVRQVVENFLLNQFRSGALQGTTPQQAYFVRCDLTTMAQADLDNGQVNCLVGVAPLTPAQFVVFQIAVVTATVGPPPQ